MKKPNLREAMPLSNPAECECCNAMANLRILVDYSQKYGDTDTFAVCITHAAQASRGEFEKFFAAYGLKLVNGKPAEPEETWLDRKPLPQDLFLN